MEGSENLFVCPQSCSAGSSGAASLTGFESFSYSDTGGDKGSFCSFSACPHLPAIDKTTSVSRHLLALIWRSDSVKSRAK